MLYILREQYKNERIRRAIKKNSVKKNDAKSDDYVYHASDKEYSGPILQDFNKSHETNKLPATSPLKPLPKKGVWCSSPKLENIGDDNVDAVKKLSPSRAARIILPDNFTSFNQETVSTEIDDVEREYLEGSDDDSIEVSSDDSDVDFYPYCHPDSEDDEIQQMILDIEEDDLEFIPFAA